METQFVILTNNQTTSRNAPKFGFNFEAVQATNNANSPVLYNWLSNYFFVKLLRYPGGTISSYWSWENGAVNESVCQLGKIPEEYCHLRAPYTISYFKNILQSFSEVIPMWDLNCLTSSLSNSLLEEAKKLEMDISHVELGNEYYLGIEPEIYPSGSAYAETMNTWIVKMKDAFPDSSFALIGSPFYGNSGMAGSWNNEVVTSADGNTNVYTLHWYLNNLPGCADVCHKVSNEMLPGWFNYTVQTWDGLVTNVLQIWPYNYKIWVTEYNVQDYNATTGQTGVVLGSWVHALLFAQQTFLLLSSPTPVPVIMAQAMGDDVWKAYINTSTPTNEAYAATPFGVVFSLFTQCGMTAATVSQLSFDPQINVSSNYVTNALYGYLFTSTGPEGICMISINLSNETASFYVPRILPEPIKYVPCSTFTIDPANYFKQNITETDLVKTNCDADVFSPHGITVPPYSLLHLSALVE